MDSYKTMNDGYIQRQSDLALIPPTEENADYVKYLADKEAGAEVLPFDYAAEETRQAAAAGQANNEALIQAEMQRILREQAIANLTAEGKL